MLNSIKIDDVLQQLGWQKNANPSYPSTPFQLIDNNITWQAGYRWLKRHRYLGVTPDSAIRYRSNEGLRIQLSRTSDKPSHLLITSLATSAWMRWLLHQGLKLRGFIRHRLQLGTNWLYHQDAFMAAQLLKNAIFITQCNTLASQTEVLRWELCLTPGKLTINLTLADNYDMTNFSRLFTAVKQLAETVNHIPHSKELSLTTAETQQLSNPEGQLKKSQVIKGGLIVISVLLLLTVILMGTLFGISWLLS